MCTFEDDYKNINVQDYIMESASGVGVYCGTYKKYNNGSIMGAWIDLEKCSDADEFFAVCRKLHKDENDPEFMFQDFQGFPREMYHESMSNDGIQLILDYLQLDEDEREMLDAYCECFGTDIENFEDFVEKAKERNMGQWDSFRDFADHMAEEEIACHSCGKETEFFERYFDYEGYARDLEMDYYTSDNGYVFSAR